MVLNHIAAILLFSGPLFYIGLAMVIFPASIARLPESVVLGLRKFVNGFGGLPSPQRLVEPEQTDVSRTVRRAVRFAGLALLLFGIVV
jgi:hypothetical protein